MIVGLTGYAQSGKDTVGEILVREHGFVRLAFADVLKATLLQLDPIGLVVQSGRSFKAWRVSELVAANGWEQAKQIGQVRELLQKLGVSARENIDKDVWVDATFLNCDFDNNIVVTDVRFPNEVERIYAEHGDLWRITRPDVGPVNAHVSESALDEYEGEWTIKNDGTVEDLSAKVLGALAARNLTS